MASLTFLADQNFNANVVRGLLRRSPDVDVVLIQDTSADGAADPDVLRWAADHGRALLTHDHRTMPDFAYARVAAGQPMPGVVVVDELDGGRPRGRRFGVNRWGDDVRRVGRAGDLRPAVRRRRPLPLRRTCH